MKNSDIQESPKAFYSTVNNTSNQAENSNALQVQVQAANSTGMYYYHTSRL
jgi:hypothetical protein